MLFQDVRPAKLLVLGEIVDGDGSAGLERATGRRAMIDGQGCMADHPLLPAHPCLDEEISRVGAIAQDLGAFDLCNSRDLRRDASAFPVASLRRRCG
jgi:hypothetical protein